MSGFLSCCSALLPLFCCSSAAATTVLTASSLVTEYVVEGDIFVHIDVVLFLHRVLCYPAEGEGQQKPRRQLPFFGELSPLDKSGSYVLQAAITVQDGSNQETMKAASQQLLAIREQLRLAVRLEQADRLSLDTRARA